MGKTAVSSYALSEFFVFFLVQTSRVEWQTVLKSNIQEEVCLTL